MTGEDTVFQSFSASLEALGPFEDKPTIAVAVSGGADSLALTLLLHQWTQQQDGKVIALTVDHGLRKEAADEAKQVNKWLTKFGVEHHILTAETQLDTKNIQENARNLRYGLMAEFCHQNNILYLATGHHADDQEETMLYRFLRGSSSWGLSGIQGRSHSFGLCLLRPLLHQPKAFWQNWLAEQKIEWIEDPSNQKPDYARNVLRKSLESLKSELPFDVAIETTHKHLNASSIQEIEDLYDALVHSVAFKPEGYASVQLPKFKTLTHSQQLRGLSLIAETISGQQNTPRFNTLEVIHDFISSNQNRLTAHGCLLEKTDQELLIMREHAKLPNDVLLPSNQFTWDKRFSCEVNAPIKSTYYVGAVPEAALKQLLKLTSLPKQVIRTLPCLKNNTTNDLESIVSVPHITYSNAENVSFNAAFTPNQSVGTKE